MNDLNLLINASDIKHEDVDSMSESSRSDSIKMKRSTKKQKQQEETATEENIENASNNSNLTEMNIIDSLDLNVKNFKTESLRESRRYSVENFPVGYQNEQNVPQISLFNNLPRSVSPKLKRATRIRQSIEGSMRSRRSSPYTTRSDSPARLLRNGKHRKLKDMNLLDGLDTEIKRRRRLCSDLSGSELSVSKLSGYESDSSYSDLASLHGTENVEGKEAVPVPEDIENKVFNPASIKRSNSETAENGPIDTNSNVCHAENTVDINLNDKKPDIGMLQTPKSEIESNENVDLSPSFKVPEKSIILDIMKQTFNETVTDTERIRNSIVESDTHVKVEQCDDLNQSDENNINSCRIENTEMKQEGSFSDKESSIQETECKYSEKELTNHIHPITNENNEQNITKNDSKSLSDAEMDTPEKSIQSFSDTSISVETNKLVDSSSKLSESAEELALKENILQALGLQSLKAAEAAKQQKSKEKVVPRTENYTGTLKTVIKINRDKKKGRNSFKMTLQKSKGKSGEHEASGGEDGYKIMKEVSTFIIYKRCLHKIFIFNSGSFIELETWKPVFRYSWCAQKITLF